MGFFALQKDLFSCMRKKYELPCNTSTMVSIHYKNIMFQPRLQLVFWRTRIQIRTRGFYRIQTRILSIQIDLPENIKNVCKKTPTLCSYFYVKLV